MSQSLLALADQLQQGAFSSVGLVDQAIAAATASESVFTHLNTAQARNQALRVDQARRAGEPLPRFAGIPITLKDLFDVQGEVTTAGSRVLAADAPAQCDATVVARLREAGFIFLGRVNMSEFAFSGIGMNPHYGTPLSVWDRQTRRLSGGSSSGSGVSVAEGIVCASIGSDTAGSTRIPAAFNGIVGYKPSHGRLPLQGIFPLSPTTDAPGPLANTVTCCYWLDAIMAGQTPIAELVEKPLQETRLLLPQAEVMNDLDPVVQDTFQRALDTLSNAGCQIETRALPVLDKMLAFFLNKPLATYEAWQAHRQRLEKQGDLYDPFVSWRIATGANISEQEYRATLDERRALIEVFNREMVGVDALVYPTVAVTPPPIGELNDREAARATNMRCLRNTAPVNYFDGCAITLPCHARGEAPVGIMLSACHNHDAALFSVAAGVERALQQ